MTNTINTRPQKQEILIDQTKDFFSRCDHATHMYVRTYSSKNLMRALQEPYRWDLYGHTKGVVRKLYTNDSLSTIDRYNTDQIKELIKIELERQVMRFTKAKDKNAIAPVDMEKIREEYLVFVKNSKKSYATAAKEFAGVPINPYQHIHDMH